MDVESRSWAETCRALGLTDGSPAECLRAIERLLANRAERPVRKERARECLRLLRGPGIDPSVAREALLLLHQEPPPPAAPDPELERLVHPDDPAWLEVAEGLTDARPARIRAFGARLVQMLESALARFRGESVTLLRDHAVLLEYVLENLQGGLSAADRLRLEGWITDVRLEQARQRARQAYAEVKDAERARDWPRVARLLADSLEEAQLDDGQRQELRRIRLEHDQYLAWRGGLDRILSALRDWKGSESHPLPWPEPLNVGDVRVVLDGVRQWGTDPERIELDRHLADIARGACALLSREDTPQAALEALERTRSVWREGADNVADSVWEESIAQAQKGMEADFERWLAAQRRGLEHPTLPDPPYPARSPAMQDTLARLQGEVERLAGLETRLAHWLEVADADLLESPELERFDADLRDLRAQWEESPLVARLAECRSALGRDLERLREAMELRDEKGYLDQAVAALKEIRSPFAQTWLDETLDLERDLALTRRIREGDWADLEREIIRAGPKIQSLWEKVQATRRLIDEIEKQARLLDAQKRFKGYASTVSALLEQMPGSEVETCEPDAARLRALKETLSDGLVERAEREIRELRAQCPPYPVTTAARLATLRARLEDLEAGLGLPGLVRAGAPELLRRLAFPACVLQVHGYCLAGRWEEVDKALAEARHRLTGEPPLAISALEAAAASARLSVEEAPASAWLDLFLDYEDVLLQRDEEHHRYLGLLRGAGLLMERRREHARVLEQRFPREAALRALLRLQELPQAFPEELTRIRTLSPADVPLVGTLLPRLVEDLAPLDVVEGLWTRLDRDGRRRAWPGSPDPVLTHERRFTAAAGELIGQLTGCERPAKDIREEVERLERRCGRRLAKDRWRLLEDVTALEAVMDELDRYDPWDRELMEQMREAERRCGLNTLAEICRCRDWSGAIQRRISGSTAAELLMDQWRIFRQRFRRSYNFQHDPTGWDHFIDTLDLWTIQLETAAEELDWSLPRAAKSHFWRRLVREWEQSTEGMLGLGDDSRPPANPTELAARYRKALEQMRDFAALHRELLASATSPDGGGPSGVLDQGLRRLHDCRPLTYPVAELRRRLMNPNSSSIGRAYSQWTRGKGTS